MNNKNKILKTLLTIIAILIVFIVVGLGYLYFSNYIEERNKSRQEAYDNLNIEFVRNENNIDIRKIEYGKDDIDLTQYVLRHDGILEVNPKMIDSSKLGKIDVVFRLKTIDKYNQEIIKEIHKDFIVYDSNCPIIEILDKEIEIDLNEEINIKDNIKVYDIVDGDIEFSEVLDKNTYIIESDFNNGIAGEYEIKVIALDKNNNRSEATFMIIVNQEIIENKTINNKPNNNSNNSSKDKEEKETQEENKEDEKPQDDNQNIDYYSVLICPGCEEWTGPKLTRRGGVCDGPSGKETYYNLEMKYVVAFMRELGYDEENYPYWVREDGCKMLGPYIMIAADFSIRPKGTLVQTSLGCGIVCDTGSFINENQYQIDIAVNWVNW